MKATLLFSALAAVMLSATPAGAYSGGPSQFMPTYPYPTYCHRCGSSYGYVGHYRHSGWHHWKH